MTRKLVDIYGNIRSARAKQSKLTYNKLLLENQLLQRENKKEEATTEATTKDSEEEEEEEEGSGSGSGSGSKGSSEEAIDLTGTSSSGIEQDPHIIPILQEVGKSKDIVHITNELETQKFFLSQHESDKRVLTTKLETLGCLSSGINRSNIDSGLCWLNARSLGLTRFGHSGTSGEH